MEDYIKFKRKNRRIYTWPCKLYIAVTLSTKNEFDRVARFNRMSQAELGAVIIMHYLANSGLLVDAINEYKRLEEQFQTEYLDNLEEQAKKRGTDPTFGGLFNSSFPESEEDE